MSKIEVNKIGPQCGTTLTVGCGAGQTVAVDANTVTIGRCGGTVALASGATQSGFGRTGTVDWQTGSIKTGDFTASNGEGYFIDTTSGEVEATLPSGSAGSIVSFQDYNNTFDDNAAIINPASGQKINGGAADGSLVLNTEGQGVTFVYIDSTVGWRSVQDICRAPAGALQISGGGNACNGSNSIFSTITAAGGGGGNKSPGVGHGCSAAAGGSGGGQSGGNSAAGAAGNTPPTTPAQGNPGGAGRNPATGAGGGGGATAAGSGSPGTNVGGAGGAGATSCITASPVARAGGGGGSGGTTPASGGTGGGGDGANGSDPSTAGTANTGGGGGGVNNNCTAGNGGSGTVIIRYKIA